MPALKVDDSFVREEAGMFDDAGRAQSFFYYRTCDIASDVFLNAVDLGAEARRAINRSTYTATAGITVADPVQRGDRLNYEVVVKKVGGKSIGFSVTMRSAVDGRLHAEFDTVCVCMDMTGPTPITIPQEVRDKLEDYKA